MTEHVLATFTHRGEAEAAARRARQELGGGVRIGDADDEIDALVLGQRAEMDESMGAVSAGVVSGPLARGALTWGPVGAVVGALATVPLALLIDAGDLPRWQVALFVALVGAFAGGTVGFVLGAGRQAVKEGETTPEDPTAVVRADVPTERAGEAIRLFVEAGARSTRLVDRPVSRPPTDDVESPRSVPEGTAERSGERADHDAGFPSDVG
jgi:hypothetical protein